MAVAASRLVEAAVIMHGLPVISNTAQGSGDIIHAPVMSKKGMAGELEVTASVTADTLAAALPAAAAKVSIWAWMGFAHVWVLAHDETRVLGSANGFKCVSAIKPALFEAR
jgi:hypothetical protein